MAAAMIVAEAAMTAEGIGAEMIALTSSFGLFYLAAFAAAETAAASSADNYLPNRHSMLITNKKRVEYLCLSSFLLYNIQHILYTKS